MFSGLVHMAADLAAGIPFIESGSLKFLMIQAIGIIGEDAVRSAWGGVGVTDNQMRKSFLYSMIVYV